MSDAIVPETLPVSSLKRGSLGKLIRNWRHRTATIACLLSVISAIAATAFIYLAPRADIASRHTAQIAAAALASAAVVLLFRGIDGRFAIQTRHGGNWQSSSVIGVLLWIACFAALSASSILVELRSAY
jgi:hypothetical protein